MTQPATTDEERVDSRSSMAHGSLLTAALRLLDRQLTEGDFVGDYWWVTMIWVVVGYVVLYVMAKSRGRNPIGWGFFGALTFLIAVVAILIAGPKKSTSATP